MPNIKISFRVSKILNFDFTATNTESLDIANDDSSSADSNNAKTCASADNPKKKQLTELESQVEDLVKVTEPSNYKTILDVTRNLYEDEISRYRFLEEKSSRFLTLISLLLPATITILFWIYSNYPNILDIYILLPVIAALSFITLSLFFILKSYSITFKPYIEITDAMISHAHTDHFDIIYRVYLVLYRKACEGYRKANKSKGDTVARAHKFLTYYFASLGFVVVFILIAFIKTNFN